MIVRRVRGFAAIVGMGMFIFSGSALATNGYFTHGVGTQSKGMAGTGVGSNADMGAIMSASNPALGVFVDDNWEAGLSIFSPRRSFVASSSQLNGSLIDLGGGVFLPSHTITPGDYDSSSEFFPIPFVAKNWSLANGANITAAFYGRGGMNTDWDNSNLTATSYFCGGDPQALEPPVTGPGPYCSGKAGVDLSQAFLTLNYAAMTSDKFAWGIGPVFGIQSFEANGVSVFTPITKTFAASGGTTLPTALSNNGHEMSFGVGIAAGIWFAMSDTVSAGLAYQSKMSMSEFDDYADLYADAGGFDIPSSIKGGISFVASDMLRVNFDIEHTAFSEVDSVGNPMANMVGCPTLPFGGTDLESCLGGANGAGFGWEDMTTFKLGFEWQRDEANTWRFGYSYGEQPIQSADVLFNILAPGVMEQHVTLGLTHKAASGGEWNFSFMYAPENSVTGPSMFDPTQTIELTMSQLEFEVSYSF
ncbi:MAG: outer membrane protein transport protein [Woeseiaceae bacterium]